MRQSLEKMTPAELCGEASSIRKELDASAERLRGVYSYLYTSVRKLPSDELTSAYLSVANSGKRFSGMVLQASKRTSGIENRALFLAKREDEERDRYKQVEAAKRRTAGAKRKRSQTKPTDPLEALFGVPLMPSETFERNSVQGSDDLDDLYGEESD
jgi:hypothetical protein